MLIAIAFDSGPGRRSQTGPPSPRIICFAGRLGFGFPTPAEEPDPSDVVTGLIDEAGSVDLGDPTPAEGRTFDVYVSVYSVPRRRSQIQAQVDFWTTGFVGGGARSDCSSGPTPSSSIINSAAGGKDHLDPRVVSRRDRSARAARYPRRKKEGRSSTPVLTYKFD